MSYLADRHTRSRGGWSDTVPRQIALGAVTALAAAALTKVTAGSDVVHAVTVLLGTAGSIWLLVTRRTEWALAAIMLYVGCLDGYLKLATGSQYTTLLRDLLLYAIVIGALIRAVARGDRLTLPPLGRWVLVFVVIALAEVFNPADGTIYHSFAGIRQNIEFVPLFFLAYTYVRTVRALKVFASLLIIIGAANGIVSTVQFNKTPAQLASWGPGYAQRVLGQGRFAASGRSFYSNSGQNLVRPFGLGSDAGDGGLMGDLAVAGVIALVSLARKRREALLLAASAVAIVLAVVTSQGRSAIICAITIVIAYGALAAGSRRGARTLIALAISAVIAFIVIQDVVASAGPSAFRYASIAPSRILSTASTNRGQSWAVIPTYVVQYPLGAGLGVAGAAAGTSGAPPAAGTVNGENEITFAILETGVPGMLTIVGFTLTLCVAGIQRCRRERDPEARLLLAAVVAPLFGLLTLYPTFAGLIGAAPGAPYLWGSGGILAYWLYTRQSSAAAGR